MTAAALVSLAGATLIVLALIAVGMRLLRGVALGRSRPGAGVGMDVVARVPLGPRQGLAAVRIAGRLVVVSVGEGGVHRVAELDGDELPETTAGPARERARTVVPFRRLAGALRGGLSLALAAALLLGGPASSSAQTARAATSVARGDSVTTTMHALERALPQMQLQVGDKSDGLHLSGTVGTVLVIGLLTLLPTLLLMMTSFTRILVVLHLLRQAMGTQTAPPAQLDRRAGAAAHGFRDGPHTAAGQSAGRRALAGRPYGRSTDDVDGRRPHAGLHVPAGPGIGPGHVREHE